MTRTTRPQWYRAVAAVTAVTLALLYLTLQVARFYQGPVVRAVGGQRCRAIHLFSGMADLRRRAACGRLPACGRSRCAIARPLSLSSPSARFSCSTWPALPGCSGPYPSSAWASSWWESACYINGFFTAHPVRRRSRRRQPLPCENRRFRLGSGLRLPAAERMERQSFQLVMERLGRRSIAPGASGRERSCATFPPAARPRRSASSMSRSRVLPATAGSMCRKPGRA